MGFKCGIIGLPNVGKSTLFNALTKINIEIANFPFCTINPNIGIVPVPDYRLKKLAEIVKPNRILPTNLKFVDIAGLVKGAYKGEGLGNRFLAHIRETEAVIHMVRCFDNEKIAHITGKIDPINDIEIINTELSLYDLDICKKAVYRVYKHAKISDKNAKFELKVLEKCLSELEKSGKLLLLNLSVEEIKIIKYLNFLTLKPKIYIANVNEDGFKDNSYLNQVQDFAKKEGFLVIPISAAIESDMVKLMEKDRDKFMKEMGFEELSLNRIIRAGYSLLNLQTFFTVGIKEIRAWTIPIGTTAQQAAGKIHTAFEKGFIRANTSSYEDFIVYKGEKGVKEAGRFRSEGKKYIVKDGDIIRFLFNA